MKIGAQLYSVRTKCQTNEDVRQTLKRMSEIGYQSVQVSGFPYDDEAVRAAADEFNLHIGLTHTGINEIINDTDEIIKKHKILGADMVGIGSFGTYKDGDIILVEDLVRDITPAIEKIKDAGLDFGYHNHHWEFMDQGGYIAMDKFYELTDWKFILDTGWVARADADPLATIEKYADRLKYVHLKDFKKNEDGTWGDITSLFNGAVCVSTIVMALNKLGTVEAAYVEQDNAVNFDCYEEMEKSISHLKINGFVR